VISLRQINALPPVERDRCYLSVVPPALCERFGLDPLAFTDPQGKPVASVEAPPGEPWVRLSIKHRADALDPALFLKLDESRYGNLQITFIILNDPEGSGSTWMTMDKSPSWARARATAARKNQRCGPD
jgi:hypothetical protein